MSLDHLNEKILDKVKERLWTVSCSLEGVGGLFTQGMREPNLDGEEFYGIGNLLKSLAQEISILEDILNCGRDSRADARNGLDKDEEEPENESEIAKEGVESETH